MGYEIYVKYKESERYKPIGAVYRTYRIAYDEFRSWQRYMKKWGLKYVGAYIRKTKRPPSKWFAANWKGVPKSQRPPGAITKVKYLVLKDGIWQRRKKKQKKK